MGERLDPEVITAVMARYFEAMRHVLELHGGTVEKFIGDAIMAVFGIPRLHEDDALRAVRAAEEMRRVLVSLNEELGRQWGITIQTRTGVNTGEVVAGEPRIGQAIALGDPVNVGARLEQAATPGEILLGEATWRLVRDAVVAEPLPAASVKGRDVPVRAYRLLDVRAGAEAVPRTLDSPMVGRDRQLALLQQTFDAAVADRACHLFTIIGGPGVGKSRLVYEFIKGVEGEPGTPGAADGSGAQAERAGPAATVLRGRCLPYGDGITYWPVAEMVKDAAAIADADSPGSALGKIARLVRSDERGDVADRLMQAIGLAEATASAEEIAWAFRKLLEALARPKPLLVVFDDIQWAEPTLVDLIDHVADWSRDVPILLIAIARQELLDHRPEWAGGKRNATTIQLEPLRDEDCETLVENLLGMALLPAVAKARIAEAAEGNPLFVEQVLSMLIDDELLRREDGHWIPSTDLTAIPIPPTIHALLGARLDRLGTEERQVIERASVVGKVFYQGAVSELAPEPLQPSVGSHLMTLVRKDLIRPDEAGIAREPTFRFRHILIRDAAYAGLPKETRAALHVGFAAWLERTAGGRITEYEEILAYHLEEAYRYRLELRTVDEHTRSLAHRAARYLASAGRRAINRSDLTAADNLLGRAAELLPDKLPERLELLMDLGQVLLDRGEFGRADSVMDEIIERAKARGDRALELRAELVQASRSDSTVPWGDRQHQVEEALGMFEELHDDRGLFQAYFIRGAVHWTQGRSGAAEQVLPRLLELARRIPLPGQVAKVLHWRAGSLVWGPTPAEEGLRVCDELLAQAEGSRFAEGSILTARSAVAAMLGLADDSRASAARGRAILEDLGPSVFGIMSVATRVGLAEELLGDLEAAERMLRPGMETLLGLGEKAFLSTLAPQLGRVLARLGHFDEAEEAARLGEETAPLDDWASQVLWRQALGLALAGRGELEDAERVLREAVGLFEGVDYLWEMSEAWSDLGHVLRLAGKADDAAAALRAALALQEAKGIVIQAAQTREALAAIT
jgi:class 3 adenylate cyclase/tetratricopeptide (TPR) repeat protein